MDQSLANLADLDEDVLESYLEETLSNLAGLDEKIADQIRSQALVPVHFGIAKQGMGITDIADSLVKIPCRNPASLPLPAPPRSRRPAPAGAWQRQQKTSASPEVRCL